MAGEPEAINGMDSTCLPNLFPVLYPLNEDVGKGKLSAWSSVGVARGISRELFVYIHKTLEREIMSLHSHSHDDGKQKKRSPTVTSIVYEKINSRHFKYHSKI